MFYYTQSTTPPATSTIVKFILNCNDPWAQTRDRGAQHPGPTAQHQPAIGRGGTDSSDPVAIKDGRLDCGGTGVCVSVSIQLEVIIIIEGTGIFSLSLKLLIAFL
jgi:hypothetical protein